MPRTNKVNLVVLVLLALLVLLTSNGCSSDDDLEGMENWRESFFKAPSRDNIITWTKIPIVLMGLIALGISISKNLNLEEVGLPTILFTVLLGIGILLIILLPEAAILVARNTLPLGVDLEWMLDKLRVTESGKLADKVYKSWVISTLGTMPTRFSLSIIMLFFFNMIVTFMCLLRSSLRGMYFFFGSLIGVGAYMTLIPAFILSLDSIWPDINFIPNKAAMNITFVFFSNFLLLLCFYAIPMATLIIGPRIWDINKWVKGNKDRKEDALIPEKAKNNRDWSALAGVAGTAAGYISGRNSQNDAEDCNSSSHRTAYINKIPLLPASTDDIIDGEYKVIIPPKNGPENGPVNNKPIPKNSPWSPKSPTNFSRSESSPVNDIGGGNINRGQNTKIGSAHAKKADPNGKIPKKSPKDTPEIFIPTHKNTSRTQQTPVNRSDVKRAGKSVEKNDTNQERKPNTKKPRISATELAAGLDVAALVATGAGHPEIAAPLKVAGTGLSAYNFAKQQADNRDPNDPIITVSAAADLINTYAGAVGNEKLGNTSQIIGTIASTAAAAREKKKEG